MVISKTAPAAYIPRQRTSPAPAAPEDTRMTATTIPPLPLLKNIRFTKSSAPSLPPTHVKMAIPASMIGGLSGYAVWLGDSDSFRPAAVREASVVPQRNGGVLNLQLDTTLTPDTQVWLVSDKSAYTNSVMAHREVCSQPAAAVDLTAVKPLNPVTLNPPEKVVDALRQAKRVLVVGHTPCDGDTVGSGLGMRRTLESLGKQADFFLDGNLPGWLRDQVAPGETRSWEEVRDQNYDLVVMIDVAQIDRIGRARELVEGAPQVVVVDHHQTTPPQLNCPVHSWIEPVDAAALLVGALAEKLAPANWSAIAAPLVTGVLTDTNSLTNKIRPETAPMLKHLLCDRGDGDLEAATARIRSRLPEEAQGVLMSPPRLQGRLLAPEGQEVRQAVLEQSDSYREELTPQLSLQVVTQAAQDLATQGGLLADANINPTDLQDALFGRLDQLAQHTPLAVMLSEGVDHVKVSIRSQQPDLAIQLAKSLGGGGKPGIAAARSTLPLQELTEIVRGWGEKQN